VLPALIAVLLAQPASAHEWNASDPGFWSVAANWRDFSVPTESDDAFIDNGGTAIVSDSNAAARDLVVGDTATHSGTVSIIEGGALATRNATLGNAADSTGTMLVSGFGATLTATGRVAVGDAGSGTLTIEDGAQLHNQAGSVAVGIGTGEENGRLIVQDGATLATGWLTAGFPDSNIPGSASVTIDGTGSSVSVTSVLTAGGGNGSSADISVGNGARLTVSSIELGKQFATASLHVDGPGSTVHATADGNEDRISSIGFSGQAAVLVDNGAQFKLDKLQRLPIGPSGGSSSLTAAAAGVVTVGTNGAGRISLQGRATSSAEGSSVVIGTGGSAGIIEARQIEGLDAGSRLIFNHSEPDYHFTNDGTATVQSIAVNGKLSLLHQGSGTTVLYGPDIQDQATTVRRGRLELRAASVRHPEAPVLIGDRANSQATLVVSDGS